MVCGTIEIVPSYRTNIPPIAKCTMDGAPSLCDEEKPKRRSFGYAQDDNLVGDTGLGGRIMSVARAGGRETG
jgi:hypothetical protein